MKVVKNIENVGPLSIDQSKHPKAKELMAMKEKNKGFIYSG